MQSIYDLRRRLRISRRPNRVSDESTLETLEVIPFEPPHEGVMAGNYLVNYAVPVRGSVVYKSSFAVYLYEDSGRTLYLVKEPYIDPKLKSLVGHAITSISTWLAPSHIIDLDPLGYLFAEMKRVGILNGRTNQEEIQSATHFLARDIIGYWLLDPLIRDPEIEDISCEGPERPVKIWHRRFNANGWLETNVSFADQERLDAVVTRLVHRSGRSISTISPIVDSVLPEGFRLTATWGREVTSLGSSFTIRKQRSESFTLPELIRAGTLDASVAAYLWLLLDMKGFVMIAGVTASGKTTLLNSIATVLNPSWKIISIEDTRELSLPHTGWKPLHTRNLSLRGSSITLFDLVKLSLRERPDFVILGESRGQEVQALFQSAASGSGNMTTFHAPNVESLIARLTQPPLSVSPSLLSLIDCIVFMVKGPDGGRRFVGDVVEMYDTPQNLFRKTETNWEGAAEESRKLEARAVGFGFSTRRVSYELKRRTEFLERLVGEGVGEYPRLSKELRKFYVSPNFTL